jgi:hypothetical protein
LNENVSGQANATAWLVALMKWLVGLINQATEALS